MKRSYKYENDNYLTTPIWAKIGIFILIAWAVIALVKTMLSDVKEERVKNGFTGMTVQKIHHASKSFIVVRSQDGLNVEIYCTIIAVNPERYNCEVKK